MTNSRQSLKFIFILLLSLGLAACASTQERLDKGRQGLETGNYVQALKYLKPLAEDGNADAQYALGYMYYYGQGVVEDPATARYWITKAAEQGQPLAEKALSMMNASSPSTAKRTSATSGGGVSPNPTGPASSLQK